MASPPSSPPQSKKPKLSPASNPKSDEVPEPPRPPLPSSPSSGKPKYKRRKIALFFGYCGFGYQGMQKNPGAKTIEADLEEALFRSWAVSESDRGNPHRCDWARSARTDKGVSAVGQVVSGRFYIDPPGLVERLNSHLDRKIRVFGFKRVTASFNAKKLCDRRRYVYLLPLFALDPRRHCGGGMDGECGGCSGNGYAAVNGREFLAPDGSRSCFVDEDPELHDGEGDVRVQTGCLSVLDAKSLSVEEGGMFDKCDSGDAVVAEIGHIEKAGVVEISHDGRVDTEGTENETESGSTKNREGEENGGSTLSDAQLYVPNDNGTTANNLHGIKKSPDTDTSGGEEKGEKAIPGQFTHASRNFCYGEEEKNRFNNVLKRYVGTHNFHNFTSRTKAEDPSALRYILSFHANTQVNIEGIEFVKCEVVGQSFMLHQIRKMIGLAVAIMRNCTSETLMDSALRKDVVVNVPTAPEIGLYLDECLFTSYNKKWKDHEELSMDSFANEAEEFKMKHIYSHIASMEQQEGAVAKWLHTLNYHRYHI